MARPKVERQPIRRLEPGCVGRIAAGEVVERPASVVKELLENSLDAGARTVRVHIRRGGLEEILIEDDGFGIPTAELPLAVERHATSKITGSGDLGSIESFGFRGEALSSVAAVSRLSIRTQAAGEDMGGRIEIVGGEIQRQEPLARGTGTTIRVADLFFNTPARRSFLKAEVAERRAVIQVVTQMAMAHPQVAMRLTTDDRTALDLAEALDLATRLHQIFGPAVTEKLRRIEGDLEGIQLVGMASLPTYTRGNRTGQYLFINRRPVFDKGVTHAIGAAYREVIPPGRFPMVVAFLDVPPSRVDVNVHPTKAEVRLRDDAVVYRLIKSTLKRGLSLAMEPPEQGASQPAASGPTNEASEGTPPPAATPRLEDIASDVFGHGPTEGYVSGPAWSRRKERPTLFGPQQLGEAEGRFEPQGAPIDRGLGQEESASSGDELFWQLHNTFILTQIRGALVIVDQHNSHERILYNEGKAALAGKSVVSQQLLFPTTLELDADEMATYEVHGGDLSRMGFQTEPFGPRTLLVRGIPSDLRNWSEGALLRDLLADMADAGRTGSDPREAILASYACHGAIRAGEKLTLPEMRGLMDRLFATELPYSCPHGRPTLVRIGLGELERRFGRR